MKIKFIMLMIILNIQIYYFDIFISKKLINEIYNIDLNNEQNCFWNGKKMFLFHFFFNLNKCNIKLIFFKFFFIL